MLVCNLFTFQFEKFSNEMILTFIDGQIKRVKNVITTSSIGFIELFHQDFQNYKTDKHNRS